MSDSTSGQHSGKWPSRTALGAMAVAAAVVAVGVYASRMPAGNGPATKDQSASAPTAPGSDTVGTFVKRPTPLVLPNIQFQAGGGKPIALDAFRGKVVLMNLWATWCIPCRKEMPALDRLQAAMGSADFEVVALSIDRSGEAGTRKFLDSVGVKSLALYVDPTAKLAQEMKAIGLPTTVLIDRQGREIGRMIGPAEWDDANAMALVRDALASK